MISEVLSVLQSQDIDILKRDSIQAKENVLYLPLSACYTVSISVCIYI